MKNHKTPPSDLPHGIEPHRIANPDFILEEIKCVVCEQIIWNPVSCS